MKYYSLLLSTIITPLSFAMEPLVEIRNRDIDTLQKPHITIINQLPTDNPYFSNTRIDISDKTKIDAHHKYKPDESTKTIWPNQGIRFSLNRNKTLEPEHKRLGLNDAEDAALIALYIHGAPNNPLTHVVVGKGSFIPFGETITITANDDGTIMYTNNDDTIDWKTDITSDLKEQQLAPIVGIPSPGSIRFRHIDSRKLDNFRLILKDNYYFGRQLLAQEFLRENPYIEKLVYNSENDNENSLDNNKSISLETLFTRGLLRSPEQYSVLALLEPIADDFNQYLEENPDLKDEYPLDDDLDEQ
jgi:hypothetical protein